MTLYAFWAAGFIACLIFGIFSYNDTKKLLINNLHLRPRHAGLLTASIDVFAAAAASTVITGIAWLIYQAS